MSNPAGYITIPPDDFGWLTSAIHARQNLTELSALAVAILESAGVETAR